MGFIMQIVNTLLWMPINWILQLLGAVQNAMEFLSQDLLEMVLFGKQTPNFQDVILPVVYYRLMLVGLVIWFVIFTCSVISYYVKDVNGDETPLGKKISKSLFNSFYGVILLFIIPIMIWLLIKLTNSLGDLLVLAFGGASANLADLLYSIGDPNWDGTVIAHNGSYPMPSNIGEWNMIVELFATIVVLLCMLLILINVITQIFSMYFYFIATFVFAIKMVFDDGAGMKEYAKTMIANALMISATLFSFNVFASLLGSVNNLLNQATITGGAITKMLLMVALCVGGAMFLLNSGQYISQMIGENIAGVSDAKDALGMVMAGAFLTSKIAKGALSKGNRLLNGRQNGNGGADGVNSMSDSGGEPNNQDGGSSGQTGDMDKDAASGVAMMNRIKQAASTRRRGGLLGLAGRFTGGALNVGKGAMLAGKTVIGSKASRMQARMQLKQHAVQMGQSMSNVAGGVIGAMAGGAGIIGGTIGINKMIKAHKNAKIRTYANADTIADNIQQSYQSKSKKLKTKSEKVRVKASKVAAKITDISASPVNNLKRKFYQYKQNKLASKAYKVEAKAKEYATTKGAEKAEVFRIKVKNWKDKKYGDQDIDKNKQKWEQVVNNSKIDLKQEFNSKVNKDKK